MYQNLQDAAKMVTIYIKKEVRSQINDVTSTLKKQTKNRKCNPK